MSIFNRFFGRRDEDAPAGGPLVANPALENGISLQVVLSGPLRLDPQQLGATLRAYHREMSRAACELDPQTVAQGTPFGLAGWGQHVVRIVGFDQPMPPQVVEAAVAPAHYDDERKNQFRRGQSHVLLYYAGYDTDPVEQFAALAAVAGSLKPFGALAVLNEGARTSLPIEVVAPGASKDMLGVLRHLPLLMLYAGFIKGEVPGIPGVWMRTFGCPALSLPDLAMYLPGHEHAEQTFELFEALLGYLRSSGTTFAPGHTSQVGEDEFLRFRAPRPDETFLYADGPLLIAERIAQSEINR